MKKHQFKAGLAAMAAVGLLTGCNGGKNQTNIELIQDMMDQINVKAQDWDPDTPDQPTMKVPPEGTLARGAEVYPFTQAQAFEAGQAVKNPIAADMTPKVIELGKKTYETYCSICHGVKGAGDGAVADKMILRPPALVSQKIRDYPDGRIYHIIVKGQGLMGQYASQIHDQKARWAVVNYIRNLQKNTSTTASN